MEYEKAIPFKNYSATDFRGRFASVDYTFKAGAVYLVPQSQALHFAQQLAVRELHAKKTPQAEMLSDVDMKEQMDKCFPGTKPSEQSTPGSFERIDEVKEGESKEAIGVKDANTTKEREIEEGEEETSDDKNNAGGPKFKSAEKTADEEYKA